MKISTDYTELDLAKPTILILCIMGVSDDPRVDALDKVQNILRR